MSLYLPTTIRQAELDILNEPYFGGEWILYLSHDPVIHLADIPFTAAATATLVDDAATALPTPTGADIQAVVINPLLSAASVVITLACLDNTGTPIAMNGVATFSPPAWVNDQAFYFPRGYAVDVIPAVGGKTFSAITSLTSATGGNKNAQVSLYQLPLVSSFIQVGCMTDATFNDRGRMAKGVDCGMETDAFVKAGKSSPGKLSVTTKFKSAADGLARFSGMKGTAKLVGIKDGQVTGDVIVFSQFRLGSEITLPEGDSDASVKGEGKFVEAMFFTAPYTP